MVVGHHHAGRVDDETGTERIDPARTAVGLAAALAAPIEEVAEQFVELRIVGNLRHRTVAGLDLLRRGNVNHRIDHFFGNVGDAVRTARGEGGRRDRRQHRHDDRCRGDSGQRRPAHLPGKMGESAEHENRAPRGDGRDTAPVQLWTQERSRYCKIVPGLGRNRDRGTLRNNARPHRKHRHLRLSSSSPRRSSAHEPDDDQAEHGRSDTGEPEHVLRALDRTRRQPFGDTGKRCEQQPLDHQHQTDCDHELGHHCSTGAALARSPLCPGDCYLLDGGAEGAEAGAPPETPPPSRGLPDGSPK